MNSQGNIQQKEQCWMYHNTQLQNTYKAIPIKTARYRQKSRYKDQWNNIEYSDMNSHRYAHLIFEKGDKDIQWRIDRLFKMLLGKVVICLQKAENRSISITLY
jgi:hypothetical protein